MQIVAQRIVIKLLMRPSLNQLRFKPGFVPTLAAALAILLTGYLGHWQQGRATEKKTLQTVFETRGSEPPVVLTATSSDPDLRYRRARAVGIWHVAGQVFLDNKVEGGVAGYHVITPLKLEGSTSYLLVNRGWIARNQTYPLPPLVTAPQGDVVVNGLLTQPSSRFLELSSQPVQGAVWQNLTIDRYRAATGLNVLPFVLAMHTTDASLKEVVERPDAGADKHIEYMLTWYSLAITVLILWLALNMRSSAAPDTGDERGTSVKEGQSS